MPQLIDDIKVSQKIIEQFFETFTSYLEMDVAIAGAGPSGMVAAAKLAAAGKKVAIYERKLSIGGGIWGGGMTFPYLVVQEPAVHILRNAGITVQTDGDGYYTANAVETATKLCAAAIDAGAHVFNAMTVEDVLIREGDIGGFVINYSAIDAAGLHVDPLTIRADAVLDATGHPCEVCHVVHRKVGKLHTPSGRIEGERSMDAKRGEIKVVENTAEVYPGLFVAGMAANAVFGSPRMGPIFGGMFLSGQRAAELILERLAALQ